MRNVVAWIKAFPLMFGSIIIALLAVALLVMVYSRGNRFVQELDQRRADVKKSESLMRTSVNLPPLTPAGDPRTQTVTVNLAAIEQLRQAYSKMEEEHTKIFETAVQFNKQRHLPMLEGLFPSPGWDSSKLFDARDRYAAAYAEMLKEYTPAPTYPRLGAGQPPDAKLIAEEMAKVEEIYLDTIFPPKTLAQLNAPEASRLFELKTRKLIELLQNRAMRIKLYAQTDAAASDYPFVINAWARAAGGAQPPIAEVWEGQMAVWITQDIVEAIARTNRVFDPKSNVMSAPVKRLVSIDIVPGYVGANSDGAILAQGPARGTPGNTAPGVGAAGFVAPTASATLDAEKAASGHVKLPDDFSKAPSGRRSNAIYDVRHAWVVVDVEWQRLPELFENFSEVNFITVLKVSLRDIDEYQVLNQGYIYGPGDTVRATILLESIWLREWTKALMPDDTKMLLGIIPRPTPGG